MKTMFSNSKSLEVKKKVRGTAPPIQLCHFCHKPITKMTGHDPDSLCNHHITYIPEVIVSTHYGCHTRYHVTHPDHPKSPESEHKKRFIESLGKDIFCHFCGEPITKLNGTDSKSRDIHSLDGDHDNWDPDNKVPCHHGCHSSFHQKGRTVSEETKQKISKAKTGKPRPDMMGDKNPSCRPEVAAKISKSLTGKPHPWQVGEKNYWFGKDRSGKNNPMYGKHHTEEAKRKMRVAKSGPENNRKAQKKRKERHGPCGREHRGVIKNKESNRSHERYYVMVDIPPKRSYRKTGINTEIYPSGSKEYQRRWYHINKQRKENE